MGETESVTACRFCGSALETSFVDLGPMPLANAFVAAEDLGRPEPRYPLHVKVCSGCLLVQHDAVVPPAAVFTNYPYFSSYSAAWCEQARRYALTVKRRLGLGPTSRVVEIGSNDGYLLKHFIALGIPVLGVDPARNVAEVACAAGVPTETRFFGAAAAGDLVARGYGADLVVANNVLAHVPDINDVIAGLELVLKPGGVLTAEFPHLLRLMREVQFDTIYHEHFFYYSLLVFERILGRHGLRIFDVEELPSHGGSLRIFACHRDDPAHAEEPGLSRVRTAEEEVGLGRIEAYAGFGVRVAEARAALLDFLDEVTRRMAKRVVGFGAAAKGSTLLNACGVDGSQIDYVVDETPAKTGKYLPGSHLPIVGIDAVRRTRPDYVLILAWNHKDEIMRKLAYIREWGGRFVVPLPRTTVLG
jgi:SAM-dependent methyltransferase